MTNPIPRELVFDVHCTADSLDDAIQEAAGFASGLEAVIAFAFNVPVGTPTHKLAYDAPPGLSVQPLTLDARAELD